MFRRGYSLVELIIVVLFLGVLTAIAIPRLNFSAVSKQKADTVARKIVTCLRRTRRLAIAGAATNSSGYTLNMLGGSPYTGYEIENRLTSATVDTFTIDSDIGCSGDNEFRFEPLGNLADGSDTELTVSGGGKSFTITVIPATGMVKCVEN